jgi:hypothetical protein
MIFAGLVPQECATLFRTRRGNELLGAVALGLELTGLISNARRPLRSPALVSSTMLAGLLRNRVWVSALKSGGSGSLPSRVPASPAGHQPAGD